MGTSTYSPIAGSTAVHAASSSRSMMPKGRTSCPSRLATTRRKRPSSSPARDAETSPRRAATIRARFAPALAHAGSNTADRAPSSRAVSSPRSPGTAPRTTDRHSRISGVSAKWGAPPGSPNNKRDGHARAAHGARGICGNVRSAAATSKTTCRPIEPRSASGRRGDWNKEAEGEIRASVDRRRSHIVPCLQRRMVREPSRTRPVRNRRVPRGHRGRVARPRDRPSHPLSPADASHRRSGRQLPPHLVQPRIHAVGRVVSVLRGAACIPRLRGRPSHVRHVDGRHQPRGPRGRRALRHRSLPRAFRGRDESAVRTRRLGRHRRCRALVRRETRSPRGRDRLARPRDRRTGSSGRRGPASRRPDPHTERRTGTDGRDPRALDVRRCRVRRRLHRDHRVRPDERELPTLL